MNKPKGVIDAKGYGVITIDEVKNAWKSVALANHLLNLSWEVYRNPASLNHYFAGSFFVPLGDLSIDEQKAKAYIKRQAQELGIALVFHSKALPPGLVKITRPRVAVLYATGEKWALMTIKVLETMEFDVNVLSAEDIRHGALDNANVLFIPGGSHTDKATAVGPDGEAKIRAFLKRGGGVLGFCGGAALASKVKDGWGLIDVEREQGKVPKAMHGPICIKPENSNHPLWYGYSSDGYPLAPWYGRAFHPLNPKVGVLGRYDQPTDDFYVYHEITGSYFNKYLPDEMRTLDYVLDDCANSENLRGMVAIAESEYGEGKIIVSYPHPETPGLQGGFLLLANAIYYITQKPPLENHPYLPSVDIKSSYSGVDILSLLKDVREIHSALVSPVAKDLAKFGVNNLYWTCRNNIPWCYIGSGKYPFYICERLEAYSDEISRQVDDLPGLINEINQKREKLTSLNKEASVREGLARVEASLDTVRHLGMAMLGDILGVYQSQIKYTLPEWATNLKKIMLYQQLLTLAKSKDASADIIEELSLKKKTLSDEYIGNWRWMLASPKYLGVFRALDNTCYCLSNLKFALKAISLEFDRLLLS